MALYIVGTPIGNLGDISPRAAEVLGAADFIAAEDTRVSLKLLGHLGIKKELVSYHEHNMASRSMQLIERMQAGESCAIITDAGMPCISDPGEVLVRLCHEHGVPVAVVPGPSAVTAAVALSGIGGRFSFEGFLSVKKTSREAHLAEVSRDPRTLVFYEAPHKLLSTLKDMHRVLGDRKLAVCRELTKLHEQVLVTTLADAVKYYEQNAPRGEFVLVIEGYTQPDTPQVTLAEATAEVLLLCGQGAALSEAARAVAHATGHRRGLLYKSALAQLEDK